MSARDKDRVCRGYGVGRGVFQAGFANTSTGGAHPRFMSKALQMLGLGTVDGRKERKKGFLIKTRKGTVGMKKRDASWGIRRLFQVCMSRTLVWKAVERERPGDGRAPGNIFPNPAYLGGERKDIGEKGAWCGVWIPAGDGNPQVASTKSILEGEPWKSRADAL